MLTETLPYRINKSGLSICCLVVLETEMVKRDKANQVAAYKREPLPFLLMVEGETLKCEHCEKEVICDQGTDSLRWRLKTV